MLGAPRNIRQAHCKCLCSTSSAATVTVDLELFDQKGEARAGYAHYMMVMCAVLLGEEDPDFLRRCNRYRAW